MLSDKLSEVLAAGRLAWAARDARKRLALERAVAEADAAASGGAELLYGEAVDLVAAAVAASLGVSRVDAAASPPDHPLKNQEPQKSPLLPATAPATPSVTLSTTESTTNTTTPAATRATTPSRSSIPLTTSLLASGVEAVVPRRAPSGRRRETAASGADSGAKRGPIWPKFSAENLHDPVFVQYLHERGVERGAWKDGSRFQVFALASSVYRRWCSEKVHDAPACWCALAVARKWYASKKDEDWAESAISLVDGVKEVGGDA